MARNFNLTQTGEEVQHILDTATPVTDLQQEAQARQQADTLLQQNIDAESVRAQQAEQQEAQARQQAVSALAEQITQTLTDYYLKTETMSATEIQTLVSDTIAAYYTKLQVDALIQDFITKSVNDLTNYYLKTEIFTKTEVQQLIAAVKQFRYQSVAVLPTASAETMNIIYLVPSENPKTSNVKDEFITTSQTNEQLVTTYQWEQIGSTTVDLSGYSTTEQMNTAIAQAISTALAQYYTKSETMSTAQVNAAIEQAVNTAIADYYTKLQVDALIQDFITASVSNLTNYYLKTETFTKAEVQQLIAAVKQFSYQSVAVLPTASAETMNIIYLVPSANPKAENVKDEFITTSQTNEQGVTTYQWEQIGSTTVDLSGYSTTEQMNTAIAQAISTALASYYTKSETMSTAQVNAAIEQAVNTAIADYYTKLQVDALIQDFITASVSNLTNYYLKTETFTKAEVQQLIDAVKQFRYQSVAVLPTASAETMNIIYLVPSDNPKTRNVKDEFITTSQTNEQGVTTYQWEQIGSTTVDLSGYSTTEQMNAAIAQAISTALAQYYTKSETMSTAQVNAAIEQAVNTAIANYYTKAQTDAAINAALANYYTKAQADEAVTAAIATALAAYYTKTEVNALLDTIRQSVTAETNARTDADATLRGMIQQVSTSLANYYLKTETYSRSEVQQLVDNVRQFQYKVVPTLPQPTADTVGWIYLVPGSHTETQNVKEEYITILDGSSYKWEHIGSTNVDLSGYSTTEEMNAAIASALASYYTKAQVDEMVQTINTAISQKQDTIGDLATIRSGAAAGATALQPAALNPYYTKQETDNLLAQKQASITDGAQIGLGFGVSSDAATVQARTATIANFILLKNMPVSIRFTNAINVDSATLNISSTGAKPILIEGAALQPGVVKAGNVVTLIYDGTNWNIVEILNVLNAASGLSVDMGLPSGRLWAIANIDVTKQSGFAEVDGKPSPFVYEGTFFSWGNTEGHNPISDSAFSYDWGTGNNGPYAQTPGAQLTANAGLSFDAARAILGAPWRDPSTEDFAELFANIDYVQADGETVIDASQANKLVTVNGIVGIYLKSKINGRLLFFACGGYGSGQSWYSRGSLGYYWSRSLGSQTYGRALYFSSGGVNPQSYDYRFDGFALRAVQ